MKKNIILATLIMSMAGSITGCGGSAVSIIETGRLSYAAVTENGSLYIWGSIDSGYFGDDFEDFSKPRKILEENIVDIKCGEGFGGALSADGTLYMWGNNSSGQLGRDPSGGEISVYDEGIDTIDAISVMENVVSFDCGTEATVAVREDGNLYQWGYGDYTPVLIMEGMSSVYCCTDEGNRTRYLAISEDGGLYSWGYSNEYPVLGTGPVFHKKTEIPQRILDDVVDVDMDSNNSAAVTSDGNLYIWGSNMYGQIGDGEHGTDYNSCYPKLVMNNVASVSISFTGSAAVTRDGDLYVWGRNENKSGFNEVLKPLKIMENVAYMEMKYSNTAAITTDGTLYMWGENNCGQLGNGKSGGSEIKYDEGIDSDEPVEVMKQVAQVKLGSDSAVALTENGELYAWGFNKYGQIGNGKKGDNVTKPTRIKLK